MSNTPLKRAETALSDRWQLEDIFETNESWENAYRQVSGDVQKISAYQGKLSQMDQLKRALDELFSLALQCEKLYCYARMRRDEDNNISKYQALVDRAQSLLVSFQTITSFIAPELLEQPDDYLKSAIEHENFADYRVYIGEILRGRPHTLSTAEERIIAMAGDMGAAPDTIYSMLSDADMKFPRIKDEKGEDVELTHANFIPFMMSRDREVRKGTFDALYTTYKAYESTIPAIYSASVKADIFYARTANFTSSLSAKLFPDAVPEAVYTSLVEAVHRHLPALNRYVARNARLIGLEKPAMYDVYVPATQGFDINLPFGEAYALVVDCLYPLGEDYQAVLRRARAERWIDPYENAGKSPGAYSWGTYDTHPYVLMNYNENLDSLQTIAHEMGHAMHSYLSNAAQPYAMAEYSLFVAEVASTVNEVLVLLELLERYPEKGGQAYLLNNLLDSYRTTLFRQTLFAEFEKESHEMAERGEPLTGESLNAVYGRLNAMYYEVCEQGELIPYEWMRIPHFYRAFYVYQYATGFSAAMALAAKIRREGAPAVEGYKRFLSAGGSLKPIEALKLAGIDMSSPEPVEHALNMFEQLLERYEAVTQAQE